MEMKNKLIWCMIIITLLSCFVNINVEGTQRGIGVGPNKIDIDSAVRNATYQQTVYVYNQNDGNNTILLDSRGDTKNWVKFYEKNNLTTPINSTFIKKRDDKGIVMTITIPSNASNKEYNGTIIVSSRPTDVNVEGNYTEVILNLPIEIFIKVVGEQNIDAEVKSIDIGKSEVNYPCPIRIVFKNTGNVVARPKTEITLTRDGAYVEKISAISPNIQPTNMYQQNIMWNTSGKFAGEYNAHFNITLEDKTIKETNISFELFPAGTFKTNGTLLDLTYEGDIEVGNLIKIIASFRNRGEIETTAKFVGEVYKNQEFIDKIESAEFTINRYSTQDLEAYYRIEQEGKYIIKGYVLFSPGRKTNTIDLILDTNKDKLGDALIDIPLLRIAPIMIIIFIVIILLKYPSIIRKIKTNNASNLFKSKEIEDKKTKNKTESGKHFLSKIKKHISAKNPEDKKNNEEKKEQKSFLSKIKNSRFSVSRDKK